MTHPSCPELLAALADECVAVRSFVELLQEEQRLLTENNTEQLLALTEQKSLLANRLNELTEVRSRLLQKNRPVLSGAAVQAWLGANSVEGLAIWQEIHALAEQAQQLNLINGELIQMKQRHNQQSLAALNRAVSKANLYGPDGQTDFKSGSGRSLGNG